MRVCAYFGISLIWPRVTESWILPSVVCTVMPMPAVFFPANDWSTGRSCGDDYSLPTVP